MTEELVTFETAKLAREKVFDEECNYTWEYDEEEDSSPKEISPPTIQQMLIRTQELAIAYRDVPNFMETVRPMIAAHITKNSLLPKYLFARPTQALLERWLREVHKLPIMVDWFYKGRDLQYRYCLEKRKVDSITIQSFYQSLYDTYELALEAALLHALNLLP